MLPAGPVPAQGVILRGVPLLHQGGDADGGEGRILPLREIGAVDGDLIVVTVALGQLAAVQLQNLDLGGAVGAAESLQLQDQGVPVWVGDTAGLYDIEVDPSSFPGLMVFQFRAAAQDRFNGERVVNSVLGLGIKPDCGCDGVRKAVAVQVDIFQPCLIFPDLRLRLLLRRVGEVLQGAAGPGVGGRCLLHLAGDQIAAEDAHGEHQDQKQHRGALLGPGHDIADTYLRLPGRPGQGGGEGGAGHLFIHSGFLSSFGRIAVALAGLWFNTYIEFPSESYRQRRL